MGKVLLIGQNLGRIFKSYAIRTSATEKTQSNLKLITELKQLLGPLLRAKTLGGTSETN